MNLAKFTKTLLGCACAALVLAPAGSAQAKGFKVIYTFCSQNNCSDGGIPYGGLILDNKGNLYGTTSIQGNLKCHSPFGCGTMFELTTQGALTGLHSFKTGQGQESLANLVPDKKGNLYGSLTYGGNDGCNKAGCGTVYKLAADGTETTLYVFTGGADGGNPFGTPIMDKDGNLYGTTVGGGLNACGGGCGTVYKVTPSGTETVLYNFCSDIQNGNCLDGIFPEAGLIADKAGNLYGTVVGGGSNGYGAVFELAPDGTETVLYSFKGGATDGGTPEAAVIADSNGNLFGTTIQGGSGGDGTVFKLTPGGVESVLHSFTGGSDGDYPTASLIEDNKGNLYGTTFRGGGSGCAFNGSYGCGTVFEVTQKGTEKVLHNFGSGSDGFYPYGSLVADGLGNIYGTAPFGGSTGWGTVFMIEQ